MPCTLPDAVMFPPPPPRGGGGGNRGRAGGGGAGQARGAGGGAAADGPNFNVGGYQFDFNFDGRYPGQLYENGLPAGAPEGTNTRGIITYKGQIVHMLPGGERQIIGCVGEDSALKGVMNINDWNYIHIIAKGGTLIHILNGRLMSLSIDDDPARRKDSGLIAVQIEGQGEVYFRNIWLKNW